MELIYVVLDHQELGGLLTVTKDVEKAVNIFTKNRTYLEVWTDSELLFECGCTHENDVYRCFKYNKEVYNVLRGYLKMKI
ncbi:hypothetical protein 0105phi72_087 [Bacillus phage 0105phi7-2]|uniref:Uncharacterized protein n=1 Tax=Bacillus phage 0105phi7-2 TaxID=3025408 RepID=A0AAF0BYQ5_9CAUD|nr:hypothetical protein P9653_gp85 [Bacillus phage 0105phi7-2]WCS66631.1 hypothetical protein 0105phi72_087 [Bacillus phage 0105phi7-2]